MNLFKDIVCSLQKCKVNTWFDIDKLNIYWPNYRKFKITAEEEAQYESFKKSMEFVDMDAVSYNDYFAAKGKFDLKIDQKDPYNQLLELEKQILLHPRNAHHLFLPVVDDIIASPKTGAYGKIHVDLLGNEAEDSKSWINSLQPHENVKKSIIFVKGKFGVGIVALDITFNTLGQVDRIQINPTYNDLYDTDENGTPMVKRTNLLFEGLEQNFNLANYTDSENNIISEVLSQLLTTQVDNVKNPVGIKLGINTQTLNTVGYLIKRGVGFDTIIKFIKQPLIQEYLIDQRINESLINKTNGKEYTKDKLIERLLTRNGYKDRVNPYTNNWTITDDMLNKGLKDNTMDDDQLRMFMYFQELIAQSRALSFVMQDQTADTKGIKDRNGFKSMMETFENALQSNFITDYAKLRSRNLLSAFTEARELYNELYGSFYQFEQTAIGTLIDSTKKMMSKLQKTKTKKERVLSAIDSDFLTYLIQRFSIEGTNEFDRLFGHTEEKSLAERVLQFKNANPSNIALKAFFPLLKTRKDEISDKYLNTLRLFERDNTNTDLNDLIESVREIYETDAKLYEDIVKFIFFQTGLKNSPFNYSKIIPQGNIRNRETTDPNEFLLYDLVNDAINSFMRLSEEEQFDHFEKFITLFQTANAQFLRRTKSVSGTPYKSYPLRYALMYENKKPVVVDTVMKQITPATGSTYHLRYDIDPQNTSIIKEPGSKLQVRKIISGAQTGIDQMGLIVGRKKGFETGGTTTIDFGTESGKDLSLQDYGVTAISKELQDKYNLDNPSENYKQRYYKARTEQNIINSDGTVYFATKADSAGLSATQNFAKKHGKPFVLNPTVKELSQWLKANNIQVLNVAGNRMSKLSQEDYNKFQSILEEALTVEQTPQQGNLFESVVEIKKDFDFNSSNVSEKIRNEYLNYVLETFGNPKIELSDEGFLFTFPDEFVVHLQAKGKLTSVPKVSQKVADLSTTDPNYDIKLLIGLNKLAEIKNQNLQTNLSEDVFSIEEQQEAKEAEKFCKGGNTKIIN